MAQRRRPGRRLRRAHGANPPRASATRSGRFPNDDPLSRHGPRGARRRVPEHEGCSRFPRVARVMPGAQRGAVCRDARPPRPALRRATRAAIRLAAVRAARRAAVRVHPRRLLAALHERGFRVCGERAARARLRRRARRIHARAGRDDDRYRRRDRRAARPSRGRPRRPRYRGAANSPERPFGGWPSDGAASAHIRPSHRRLRSARSSISNRSRCAA